MRNIFATWRYEKEQEKHEIHQKHITYTYPKKRETLSWEAVDMCKQSKMRRNDVKTKLFDEIRESFKFKKSKAVYVVGGSY